MITSHFRTFIDDGPCTNGDGGGQQQSQSNGNR